MPHPCWRWIPFKPCKKDGGKAAAEARLNRELAKVLRKTEAAAAGPKEAARPLAVAKRNGHPVRLVPRNETPCRGIAVTLKVAVVLPNLGEVPPLNKLDLIRPNNPVPRDLDHHPGRQGRVDRLREPLVRGPQAGPTTAKQVVRPDPKTKRHVLEPVATV